jgi:hypothetical protein
MKYLLIIISIIVIFLFIYTIIKDRNNKNNMIYKIIYKKRLTCEYKTGESLLEFFNNYGIENYEIIKNSPNINLFKKVYIPCTYDDPEKEINEMDKTKNNYYMIINKCDIFVGKNYLWNFLKMFYGDDILQLLPKSYITYDKESMEQFKKDYDKDKLYIMKKNVQRQEGIRITKDYDKLVDGSKDDYIIIQELLQNPFLLNQRKINLRVYILLTIKNDTCSIYVYTNGFMYYTPEFFIKGSADLDRNVTTGYIDRKIYEENPLTHDDFRKYLGESRAKIVFFNVYELIRKVMTPFQIHLVEFQAFPGSTQFQVFGSDVAVNDDLSATLMEINKGPDLSYKDKRDGEVKKNLIEDMFNIIGVVKRDIPNRFYKIA